MLNSLCERTDTLYTTYLILYVIKSQHFSETDLTNHSLNPIL